MVGPEMSRYRGRVNELVKCSLVETDRERFDRAPECFCISATIVELSTPPDREGSERHIGDHLRRTAEPRTALQLFHSLTFFVPRIGFFDASLDCRIERPDRRIERPPWLSPGRSGAVGAIAGGRDQRFQDCAWLSL